MKEADFAGFMLSFQGSLEGMRYQLSILIKQQREIIELLKMANDKRPTEEAAAKGEPL